MNDAPRAPDLPNSTTNCSPIPHFATLALHKYTPNQSLSTPFLPAQKNPTTKEKKKKTRKRNSRKRSTR